MKQEDIKKAIIEAAMSELRRSYYNAAGVIHEIDLHYFVESLENEVFGNSSEDFPTD